MNSFEIEQNLRSAVRKGHIHKVTNLIKSGVDINAKDERGFTPLSNACECGQYEIAKFLLENGANPNTEDSYECTPIHRAMFNNTQIVELLISYPGVLDYQVTTTGISALMIAFHYGLFEAAELLHYAGASHGLLDKKNRSIFEHFMEGLYDPNRVDDRYKPVYICWEACFELLVESSHMFDPTEEQIATCTEKHVKKSMTELRQQLLDTY